MGRMEKAWGADDGAGGGDIRGVHLAGCCQHAVGVCDDIEKAGGADDGAAGAAGRGDIRGVQAAKRCMHEVCVGEDGENAGRPGEGVAGSKALLEPATLHSVCKRKDRDGETRN